MCVCVRVAGCIELLRQVPMFRVLSVDSGALLVALINHDRFQSFRVLYRPLGQSVARLVFLVSNDRSIERSIDPLITCCPFDKHCRPSCHICDVIVRSDQSGHN